MKTFLQQAEAYQAREQKSVEIVTKYCDNIKTLEDLLKFPMEHPFGAEEYTDYEAIQAYKTMCKKIANIDIK